MKIDSIMNQIVKLIPSMKGETLRKERTMRLRLLPKDYEEINAAKY
jgi:hypothetical protein